MKFKLEVSLSSCLYESNQRLLKWIQWLFLPGKQTLDSDFLLTLPTHTCQQPRVLQVRLLSHTEKLLSLSLVMQISHWKRFKYYNWLLHIFNSAFICSDFVMYMVHSGAAQRRGLFPRKTVKYCIHIKSPWIWLITMDVYFWMGFV